MKRISQKRRLMVVKYQNQRDVDRLDTCLKMCCLPHVIFKEYEFVGGGALRIVLPKDKPCRHAMRVWSDHDFTIYPFQVGVPFYFEKEDVA